MFFYVFRIVLRYSPPCGERYCGIVPTRNPAPEPRATEPRATEPRATEPRANTEPRASHARERRERSMSHLSFADFRAGTMRIVSARVDLVYLQVFSNFDFL